MGTLEQDTTLTHPTHNYNENRYSRIATGKMKLLLLVLTSFVCALCIISVQGKPWGLISYGDGNTKNYGKHCWNQSGCKDGSCFFCGTGNCCRKDWEDNKIAACNGKGISTQHHLCV